MKDWEESFAWNRVQNELRERMNLPKAPDLNGILFLIGIQELGRWQEKFTKEQKIKCIEIINYFNNSKINKDITKKQP